MILAKPAHLMGVHEFPTNVFFKHCSHITENTSPEKTGYTEEDIFGLNDDVVDQDDGDERKEDGNEADDEDSPAKMEVDPDETWYLACTDPALFQLVEPSKATKIVEPNTCFS